MTTQTQEKSSLKKKIPQPILQATPTVVPLPPYLGPRAGHTTHEIHLSVHCTTIGPVFMVQNTAFWWQVYAFCVGEPLPKYNVVGSHLPKYYYIREPPHMG